MDMEGLVVTDVATQKRTATHMHEPFWVELTSGAFAQTPTKNGSKGRSGRGVQEGFRIGVLEGTQGRVRRRGGEEESCQEEDIGEVSKTGSRWESGEEEQEEQVEETVKHLISRESGSGGRKPSNSNFRFPTKEVEQHIEVNFQNQNICQQNNFIFWHNMVTLHWLVSSDVTARVICWRRACKSESSGSITSTV